MDRLTETRVEWAVASRPLEPEVSGDAYLARPLPGGILLGVVDGLGHGPAASAVSREAIRFLETADEHPLAVVRLCHERLRATRGVVLTLAWIDEARDCMTWLGVGNVQGVLLRARGKADPGREALVGRGGIVGRVLPPLQTSVASLFDGDLLVLATDGIHPRFTHFVPRRDSLQTIADLILTEHCTGVDDALVLTARYRGAPG